MLRSAFLVSGLLMVAGCSANAGDDAESASADLLTNLPACQPLNDACEAAEWRYETRGWKRWIYAPTVTKLGGPLHRGRDMFYTPNEKQIVHAKFAYSVADTDLRGEDVDVFVQRDCASGWEKLGTAQTSWPNDHATVDAVADNGGRIYFEIPEAKKLGPGRHRIRSVVAGDGTYADSFIDIIPAGTPVVVSDVDGTLTSSEHIEYVDLPFGITPDTHEGAPEALRALAEKGYRMMYLTARPEALTGRTRQFLAERGFPTGIVHTSSATLGAGSGDSAQTYKTEELALLKQRGFVIAYGFGNRITDANAYASVIADPQHRVLYQLDDPFTGRRIESYTELLPGFASESEVCQ